jgi:hypothetical protein
MKHVIGYAIVLVIAGGLATVAVAQRSAAPAAPAGYPVAWEYARLRYSPLQTDWSWRSGGENTKGDAGKIYRAVGGPPRPVSNDIWYGEVVSAAGQQGWEVILMRDYEQGSEVWFKRPTR